MLVASPRLEPEPCRIAIARCEAEAWDARARPARGDSLAVTRESAAPACGRRHRSSARLAGADPLCWRYAECEILAILAQFRELRLGSGPRNRVPRGSSKKTRHREVAKPGIALGSGPRDRGFESRLPDHSFLGEEAAVC